MPAKLATPSAGRVIGTVLSAAMPMARLRMTRICTGTAAAPKTGAATKAAPGRIIAMSHSQSCASTPAKPGAIMAPAEGFGRSCQEVRNALEDFPREVDHERQDRAAKHDEHEAD